MDNQITLKYQKNKSQEIRIEKPILEFKEDDKKWTIQENDQFYFMQEYQDALEIINGILNNKDTQESANNRILFVGQRGTGKTSAMKSFADGLDEAKKDKKKVFERLVMIEPSHFDNSTNLLQTVITRLYDSAVTDLMKRDGNIEDVISGKEVLVKQFNEVYTSLRAISGNIEPSFTLEGLNEKSKALNIRKGMGKLVDIYIKLYNEVNKTSISNLVLVIDDIDTTVSHAHEMLDQLGKYLDVENLIILMSANLGQLFNEIREYYSKAYKETLKDTDQATSIDVEDMANKYLLKLFPTSHRVRVEHSDDQLLGTTLQVVLDENEKIEGCLQKVVLSLIWRKTRLLFIPKDAETILHPIIPTNLRELMQFLDMLTSLKNVRYEKTDEMHVLFGNTTTYDNFKDNVARFKKYILNNWIPDHLSVEEEKVFENIPADITEINKHLINSINVIGTKHKKRLMSREVELEMIERNAENVNIDRDIYTMVSPNDPKFVKANKISDIFNQPSNYSYGDLLLMIDKYETYFESDDDRKFTDAIKIYYSILLFETMFFKSNSVTYNYDESKNIDDYPVIPIQKLIGGTVYYPNYFEIIEDKYFNQKGPWFDAKRVFYHKLPIDEERQEKVGSKCPFFSVLYYGDIRPDRYDTKHIYDTTYEKDADVDGTKFVTFDILSILSNMLNPCHTISRATKKTDVEKLKRVVNNWAMNCKVDEETIPNSILPFYSVDMMLHYLRKSYSADEFEEVKSFEELAGTRDIIKVANNYKVFFNEGNPFSIKDSNNNPTIVSISNVIINTYKTNIIEEAKVDFDRIGLYVAKSGTENVKNVYRDYIVSLLLKSYKGSRRDLAMLIRDIDKCHGMADMYECIVKTLWKETIIEQEVRIQIQERVHKPSFVTWYYAKLKEKTQALLNGIELNKNEIWSVYEKIYEKASPFLQ